MDNKKALQTLENYNKRRRDSNIPNCYEMPAPKDIGLAIDTAIEALKHEEIAIEKYINTKRINNLISDLRIIKLYIKKQNDADAIEKLDNIIANLLDIKLSRCKKL